MRSMLLQSICFREVPHPSLRARGGDGFARRRMVGHSEGVVAPSDWRLSKAAKQLIALTTPMIRTKRKRLFSGRALTLSDRGFAGQGSSLELQRVVGGMVPPHGVQDARQSSCQGYSGDALAASLSDPLRPFS